MSFKNEYFLLRHSDTDRSKDVHFSEHELSEVGKSQSQEIVLILENLNIGLVYSSPYKRALQTVGPFLNKLELEVNIDDRLSGRKVGDISKEEVWTFFEDSWNDFEFTKQGAESASECRGRISSLIESLESEHIGKKILLVSHSNPIAFYLSIPK